LTAEAIEHIGDWRSRLRAQTIISSNEVQNRLFDLYGDLEEYPAVERIKPWLTLTVSRQLFRAEELEAFLAELQAELTTEPATN
jgi:hypothetical protein